MIHRTRPAAFKIRFVVTQNSQNVPALQPLTNQVYVFFGSTMQRNHLNFAFGLSPTTIPLHALIPLWDTGFFFAETIFAGTSFASFVSSPLVIDSTGPL